MTICDRVEYVVSTLLLGIVGMIVRWLVDPMPLTRSDGDERSD